MLDCFFRADFNAAAAFGALVNVCGNGFFVHKCVDFGRADVHAFAAANAFLIIDLYRPIITFPFFNIRHLISPFKLFAVTVKSLKDI